jgi:hypothetical protein
MSIINLQYRQTKIQDKRKARPWRDFVMEIGSWLSLGFYKNNNTISRYPFSPRINNLVTVEEYFKYNGEFLDQEFDNNNDNFIDQLQSLYISLPLPYTHDQ